MKNLLIILFFPPLIFIGQTLQAQEVQKIRLKNQDYINSNEEGTIGIIGDSGDWLQITTEQMKERFNPLRTPTGNIAEKDSTIEIHGLTLDDFSSTFKNEILLRNRILITNSEYQPGSNKFRLGGGYETEDRGSFLLGLNGKNGVNLTAFSLPDIRRGRGFAFHSKMNMTDPERNFKSGNLLTSAFFFEASGCIYDENGLVIGTTDIKKPIMGVIVEGQGDVMGLWYDSTKIYRSLQVVNDVKEKVIETKKDRIDLNKIVVHNSTYTTPILTTEEAIAIRDLANLYTENMVFWHDINGDKVGDVLVFRNGAEWRKIATESYTLE